ncbi:MAG: antibiotic biosynthesis monooxygenase [Sphingomonadales bacterium]|jgi:heme-degrading monooxygenase HmoA|nr:antibiotic biosynthesis monooxygenase [Sphingomonadales bacterium]
MITEIALITIDPSKAAEFEAAVAKAAPVFQRAAGCHGMSLERGIEDPSKYWLRVLWETVDHHLVTFRQSDDFQVWRGHAGPFFAHPPQVEHSEAVAVHF